MANQTLSLNEEAYERLQDARMDSNESLSDVVMRARWDHEMGTGGGLFSPLPKRARAHDAEELDVTQETKSENKVSAEVIDALTLAVARLGT